MTASQAQSDVGLKERFFRDFQRDVAGEYLVVRDDPTTEQAELQAEMERLSATTPVGNGRNEAVDRCLAGIDRLSHEVKDASSYIPAYDQRTYSQVHVTHGSVTRVWADCIRPSKRCPRSSRPSATPSTHQRSSRSERARMLPFYLPRVRLTLQRAIPRSRRERPTSSCRGKKPGNTRRWDA
jgi:hypothetical protein